jgi:sugar lactone lactonase YvrE
VTGLAPLADGFSLLEVPRWNAGRLVVADVYTDRILAVGSNGSVQAIAELPDHPAGLGWRDGQLLVALMNEKRVLLLRPDGPIEIADLRDLAPARLNDMSVAPDGRAYVGNFGLTSGTLIRVEADGTSALAADDLLLPNGSVITPDGTTLIVAESAAQRLTAFTIDADGTLTDRRTWAAFGEPPTARALPEILSQLTTWPDGIALDADGAIWVADGFGSQVLRVREGGEVTDRLSTGALGCIACTLGGPDGHTLFVCAAPRLSESDLAKRRDAVLLHARVPVPAA